MEIDIDITEAGWRNVTHDDFELEQFSLDFTDAFWQVPLRPDGRRYFVRVIKGYHFSYNGAAHGSRNVPLSLSAGVSLAIRAVQLLFRVSCLSKGDHALTKA